MRHYQRYALDHHCRLGFETANPKFCRRFQQYSVIVTVNSGYEGLEENYGGPVWHASAAPTGPSLPAHILTHLAMTALAGVGDASCGEWVECGRGLRGIHVRRRLRSEEEALIGPARDIRGTPEAEKRYAEALVGAWPGLRRWMQEELRSM